MNKYVSKGGFVMANDLFGGLNGLMKGFSNFMPQDDPRSEEHTSELQSQR